METPPSRPTKTVESEKSEPRTRPISYPNSQNNFPYSIKSTNSSICSHSCSSRSPADYKHSYMPVTPSRASNHGHSLSDLSRDSPKPLPMPSSLETPPKLRKNKHINIGSVGITFPVYTARASPLFSPIEMDDLPSNPRVWTNSQLASYLITALRVKSGERLPLPFPVAEDIVAFVKKTRLNGRAFLRLDEKDFQAMGINNLWSRALVNASRNLQDNVLNGRIWGFDTDFNGKEGGSPYKNVFYNSSSSSIEELSESQIDTPSKSKKLKGGSVRTLEASLEGTSSPGSGHRDSMCEGESRGFAFPWVDDEVASASGSEVSDHNVFNAPAAVERQTVIESFTRVATQNVDAKHNERKEMIDEELLDDPSNAALSTVKPVANMKSTSSGESFVPPNGAEQNGSGITHLPSPPASDTRSPEIDICTLEESQKLALPLSKDERQSEIADGRSAAVGQFEGNSDGETSRLREAISLTEDLRARLAIVEQKLNEIDHRDTGHYSHLCQANNISYSLACPADAPNRHANATVDVSMYYSKSMQTEEISATRRSEPWTASVNTEWTSGNPRHPGDKYEKRDEPLEDDLNPLANIATSYIQMAGIGICVAVAVSTLLKRLPGTWA